MVFKQHCFIPSSVRAAQYSPQTAAPAPHLRAPEWAQLVSGLPGWKLRVLPVFWTSRLLRILGQLRGPDGTQQRRQPRHQQRPLTTGSSPPPVLKHSARKTYKYQQTPHICCHTRKRDTKCTIWKDNDKHTHTLRPPRCHWGDIDENLVRLENTVAFHFCLFRRAVWWIWNVANVSLWGGKKDQTWGRMYGCRMMTQIKTEKTIMVDYTVISVHQWLPTGPEDGLTGGKRAFNRHKGWPAHVQCMLGTNSHERESQTPVRHW